MIWNETEITARIFEIENDPRVNLKVPEKLINPDPLVVDAKQSLAKKENRSSWLLETEGVVSNASALLIRVAPGNVDRALRLFDTVIKVFERVDIGLKKVMCIWESRGLKSLFAKS